MELKEYQKRIAYQIYPASFKDSNNDGWGDIKGIISKLPYLKELGIGMVWLSPIYASPMDDMGYDISDYKSINPLFGTMDDFDELIKVANELDIKIVMDLVINHTSTEHKWFKEAIKDKNSKYRDYYIIEKGKGKKTPNNWDSCFTGTCWKKLENSDNEYYMHLFCDTQADLNFKNHAVVEEIKDILKFWLDKGVYGFRCDVINCLYKTTLKNDSPFKLYGKGEKYYFNQEGFFDIMKEIRRDVLDKYDTFLLGETSHIDATIGKRFIDERILDTFFEFDHMKSYQNKLLPVLRKKFKPSILINAIKYWQENIPWMSNYLENHDQLRSMSVYGDEEYFFESGSLLATLLLTLRGTPFIYQGEEIGTLNDVNVTKENTNDVSAKTVMKKLKHSIPFLSDDKAFKMVNETVNRDHARKPMMFDDSINGGFNTGHEPWIGVNEQYHKNNVKNQLEGKTLFNFYRAMIQFRKDSDVLMMGDINFEFISDDINTYTRTYDGKTYLIVLNFSKNVVTFNTEYELKLLFANYFNGINLATLPPYFAGVFEITK